MCYRYEKLTFTQSSFRVAACLLVFLLVCETCLHPPHDTRPSYRPYITCFSRPCINTIMMGMEIGAFKAANASYIFSGSYVVRQELCVRSIRRLAGWMIHYCDDDTLCLTF